MMNAFNPALWTINKRFFVSFTTTLLCLLGLYAYHALGKLEDPAFTVKNAAVVTLYPGASAEEVELRVTDVLERKFQEMGKLWKLRSISRPGQSVVIIELQETLTGDELPQEWDLLRRKVNDVKLELPMEAQISIVIDEFSEVYGMLFAMSGDGIAPRELNHYARMLQRELNAVQGINKVVLHGLYEPQIVIEIDSQKLAQFNLSPAQLYNLLVSQNLSMSPGYMTVGSERIRLRQSEQLNSAEDVSNLVINAGIGDTSKFANIEQSRFRLKDVAHVYEDVNETPSLISRFNGKRAITVAVNPRDGVNVVSLGQVLKDTLADFEQKLPLGVNIETIVFQPDEVQKAVDNFIGNLLSAIVIVVVVLTLFMGIRPAAIVGVSLLTTLLLTLVYMLVDGIDLHRISVGTFILALGMLVDNAIVITDLYISKLKAGIDKKRAATESVSETAMPLLAATLIAICATMPVLFSKTAAAEFAMDLVLIMASSLMLSWVVAITITPLTCYLWLKPTDEEVEQPKWQAKAQQTIIYVLNNRKKAIVAVISGIAVTGVLTLWLTVNFMPTSDRPITFIDYWLPQGGDIDNTAQDMEIIEQWLLEQPEVTSIASFIGAGAPRFSVTYEPEPNDSAYGQIIINVQHFEQIPALRRRGDAFLKATFAQAEPRFRPLKLATVDKFNIEARFSGPDPQVLRTLVAKAKRIMTDHPNLTYIRDDWRQQSKVLTPIFNQDKARLAGISRFDVNQALAKAADGQLLTVVYQDQDALPLLFKLPKAQRSNMDMLSSIPVTPTLGGPSVPLSQVTDGFELAFEEGMIHRRNRIRTMTVQADVEGIFASQGRAEIAKDIEAITLPDGYSLQWGGEYYDEYRSITDIFEQLPKANIMMLLLMVLMFNGFKQPLVIIMTIPLAFIGVVPILVIAGFPWGFMTLVGVISLSGMIIKNGIVLMDQINLEIKRGKEPFDALVSSAVNRTMAISMAALTTVLGMVPLWWDPLFGPMAATIIGGLTVATFLTLLIMPVFYAVLYKVPVQNDNQLASK